MKNNLRSKQVRKTLTAVAKPRIFRDDDGGASIPEKTPPATQHNKMTTSQPSPLFTPNAFTNLGVVPYHARGTDPLYPARQLVLRPTDHPLLPILVASCDSRDLMLMDADLCFRQAGHHYYLREGAVLFSPDRTKMTSHTTQIHRRGRAVLFPDGSRYPLGECWTAVLNQRITTIRRTLESVASPVATAITRPDSPCSICLEDLNGDLATCPNNHQIHRACFNGLATQRRSCPECRASYAESQATPNGVRPLHTRIVYPNETRENADLRFTGLLRRLCPSSLTHNHAFLDTLDFWVRKPRTDYLLDCDEAGTPFFGGFDRPAWTAVATYYTSQENRDRLKTRDLSPSTYNANYGEPEFLADLLRAYPSTATEVLAGVRTEAERVALRRECWVQYRLADPLPALRDTLTKYIERPDAPAVRTQMETITLERAT